MNPSITPEDAALAHADIAKAIRRGDLPVVTAPEPLAPGDHCHFASPVRFGRRRSDQYGHLLLTTGWMKFRGTVDLSLTWSEVAAVRRAARDIVVSLQDSRRLLRFSCHSEAEALRGVLLAEHLVRSASVHPTDSSTASEHHAAL